MTNAAIVILFTAGLVASLLIRRLEAHPLMALVDAALTAYFVAEAASGRGNTAANVVLAVIGLGATVRCVRAAVLRRRGGSL